MCSLQAIKVYTLLAQQFPHLHLDSDPKLSAMAESASAVGGKGTGDECDDGNMDPGMAQLLAKEKEEAPWEHGRGAMRGVDAHRQAQSSVY